MSYLSEKKFSFESTALAKDTFAVVEFTGSEALSRPYEFEITLVTERGDIDLSSVLQQPAAFTFHRETGGDVRWNGIVARFEQLHNFDLYTFYRAHLVPKLWWLQLTHHNQIFLDKTVKEIIETVLKDGGLTSRDFEFKLQNSYSKIDYVCQYEESYYDFVSRWMEREGLYYFFEQSESAEKVIITDTSVSHTGMPLGDTLYYSPPSGLDTLHRTEVIQSFSCRHKLIPSKVFMKDYNYETPSLTVTGSAPVDSEGRGNIYFYGENFKNPAEGNRLAKIRSEEILCRKEQYIGESTVPFVMPGYSFKLENHYRSDFNKEYLIVGVDFSGSQSGYLIAGIQEALSGREKKVYYSNNFTAIPYSVQFRTERRTKKSKIYGTLPAKVDAAGSGQYAELDEQGRYKVIMPFDESGRKDGKASIFLRMVQPYAGGDHGMHFPLHKGTEVMVTFTDGDPDRPIIAGAVPNPETQSVINSNNQTSSEIRTGGQNRIAIEDQAGSERILMQSPTANTWVRMGAPNDPPAPGPGRQSRIDELEKKIEDLEKREDSREDKYLADENYKEGIRIYTDGKFINEVGATYAFADAVKMGVYVDGKHEERATGDRLIIARHGENPDLEIRMEQDGILIDAGNPDNTGKDILIRCRKLDTENTNNTSKFYGSFREEFYGDKLQIHWGSSGEWYMGHKIEGFLGPHESFTVAQDLEMFLGLKEEFSFLEHLELFLGFKQEFSFLHNLELFWGIKNQFGFGTLYEKYKLVDHYEILKTNRNEMEFLKSQLSLRRAAMHIED